MQSLINDLLSFSRHSMGSSDFKKTDLNAVLREVVNDLDIEIEKSKAVININKLPVIWAIPSLLQQLFYNLVSNALKFKKKDTIPVVSISAEKKNQVEINSFIKRLHSYHEFEGSGVGLSICKKITEKHNGFISAASEPGKGSVFTIGFPEKNEVNKV